MNNIWIPKKTDLILSAIIALFFPLLAKFLYSATGALLPMLLYYSAAWGIAKWRRGRTGYFEKIKKPISIYFYINVFVIILALVAAYFARIEATDFSLLGVLFTALIWAPLNASSEQLLWIYLFESWDLYAKKLSKKVQVLFFIIGIIFFSVFVGFIHTLFWTQFLHTADAGTIFGIFFVLITSLSGYFHIIVWRKTGNMLFTFIPHLMLNFVPLLWTGYSMLPYLIK